MHLAGLNQPAIDLIARRYQLIHLGDDAVLVFSGVSGISNILVCPAIASTLEATG